MPHLRPALSCAVGRGELRAGSAFAKPRFILTARRVRSSFFWCICLRQSSGPPPHSQRRLLSSLLQLDLLIRPAGPPVARSSNRPADCT